MAFSVNFPSSCLFLSFQLLLYELTQGKVYKDDITSLLDSYNGGYVPKTPCGLSYRDQWGPNRHAGKFPLLSVKAFGTFRYISALCNDTSKGVFVSLLLFISTIFGGFENYVLLNGSQS